MPRAAFAAFDALITTNDRTMLTRKYRLTGCIKTAQLRWHKTLDRVATSRNAASSETDFCQILPRVLK